MHTHSYMHKRAKRERLVVAMSDEELGPANSSNRREKERRGGECNNAATMTHFE